MHRQLRPPSSTHLRLSISIPTVLSSFSPLDIHYFLSALYIFPSFPDYFPISLYFSLISGTTLFPFFQIIILAQIRHPFPDIHFNTPHHVQRKKKSYNIHTLTSISYRAITSSIAHSFYFSSKTDELHFLLNLKHSATRCFSLYSSCYSNLFLGSVQTYSQTSIVSTVFNMFRYPCLLPYLDRCFEIQVSTDMAAAMTRFALPHVF